MPNGNFTTNYNYKHVNQTIYWKENRIQAGIYFSEYLHQYFIKNLNVTDFFFMLKLKTELPTEILLKTCYLDINLRIYQKVNRIQAIILPLELKCRALSEYFNFTIIPLTVDV